MRIHEILEACVEYIAIDGVLGTDPAVLQKHLAGLDSSIDPAYFTHIYSLLVGHPAIQILITTYPLPSTGTTQTGTEPLPDDYVPLEGLHTDVDFNALYREGVRGRQLAYLFAGEQYKTGKETIESRREEAKSKAKKNLTVKNEHALSTAPEKGEGRFKNGDGSSLCTILKDNDGQIDKRDLLGLWEKWGARLRLRATDDEIYYRLTGSYQKISKLSPVVFHVLQLSARSREKGVTAIELGPMVGASQGSMHYFIKVLVGLGLCTKIPAVIHASVTNLLVFHRFVEQNSNYRAIQAQKHVSEVPKDVVDPEVDKAGNGFDLEFGPLTEADLMAGHVMKERLLRLLDHPSLNNHLLRAKNLLPLLGWQGPHVTRHSRALLRHTEALIADGLVESLLVGDTYKCLRLTKYNPEYVPPSEPVVLQEEDDDDEIEFTDVNDTYNPLGGASLTQSIEHQISSAVIKSGQSGMTIAEIRDVLAGFHKRSIEFHILHAETSVPPHLRPLWTCIVMEMVGRERRLRAFGVSNYRARLLTEGQPINDLVHPPEPPQSGHWSDLAHCRLYSSAEEYDQVTDTIETIMSGTDAVKATKAVSTKGKAVRNRSLSPLPPTEARPKKTKIEKDFLYPNEVQSRGRPRKYVYVVNDDGRRNRAIVGSMLSSPDLPPILIYVPSADKLVPAPPGYSGVGPPPTITPEMLASGHPPNHYWRFPTHSPVAGNVKGKRSEDKPSRGKEKTETKDGKGKRKREATPRPEPVLEDVEVNVTEAAESSKRPRFDNDAKTEAEVIAARNIALDPAARPKPKRKYIKRIVDPSVTVNIDELPEPIVDTINKPSVFPVPHSIPSTSTSALPADFEIRNQMNAVVEAPPPNEKLTVVLQPPTIPPGHIRTAEREKTTVMTVIDDTSMPPTPVSNGEAAVPQALVIKGTDSPSLMETDEPLRSIEDKPTLPLVSVPRATRRPGYGQHLRTNEVYQALIDAGGIMAYFRLMHEHKEWAHRVAGTNHPNAPTVAASMDRKTFHKTVAGLMKDGRFKETIATIPTVTGRWTKTKILYITDKPQTEIQAYIRALASGMAGGPNKKAPKQIPATEFTEIAQDAKMKMTIRPPPPVPLPTDSIRETLLREPTVVSQLYGFQSGRMVRAEIIHRAMIKAISSSPSVMSTSPIVFALPLLFEDITLREWFNCIAIYYYDEALEDLVNEQPDTKLRNVPKYIRPPGGFGGHNSKAKLSSLLEILVTLRVLTPLNSSFTNVAIKIPAGDFEISNSVTGAKYFVLHNYAPVYHVALDQSGLLGLMPVQTVDDIEPFWTCAKKACIETDATMIPALSFHKVVFPYVAHLSDTLNLSVDQRRLYRGITRWNHTLRPHPIQQQGLHSAVKHGDRILEQIDKLAYEYALPKSYVDSSMRSRLEKSKAKKSMGLRMDREAAARDRTKQKRAQESLQMKLAARAAAARREWEDKIRASVTRVGVEFSDPLFAFVSRQRLQLFAVEWTDSMVDDAVRAYIRSQSAVPKERSVKFRSLNSNATEVNSANRGKRFRRKRYAFTAEDDDKLLDCEAIIRARQRYNNLQSRTAFGQAFPDIGRQSVGTRIKRLLSMPGKEAYCERLAEAWHEVWLEHRGTALLPDLNPESLIDFDLNAHLQFLRERINKLNIRLAVALPVASKDRIPDLPIDVDSLLSVYQWSAKSYHTHGYVVQASLEPSQVAEDTRLHNLALASILEDHSKVEPVHDKTHSTIRAVLKMIIATPAEDYDITAAGSLIQKYQPLYNQDIGEMTKEGILQKAGNGRNAPGRAYGFTAQWNLLGEGPYPGEVHVAAENLHSKFENGSMSWPLIGTSGGDIAALMHMVSNHQVDFDFDLAEFPTNAIEQFTYNTKALNDDSFEFDLHITRSLAPTCRSQPIAPCRLSYERRHPIQWDIPVEYDVSEFVERIIVALQAAGGEGMTKAQLQTQLKIHPIHLVPAIAALCAEQPARVFWAGYDTARLIFIDHWNQWTIEVQKRGAESTKLRNHRRKLRMVTPRRWYDIWGKGLDEEWKKAVRAVRGHIVGHPGINELVLRGYVAPFLDRLETTEVLQQILDLGEARRVKIRGQGVLSPVEATDVNEENDIAWWPDSEKLWV